MNIAINCARAALLVAFAASTPFTIADSVIDAVGAYKSVVATMKGFDPYSFVNPQWLDNRHVLLAVRPLKEGANDDGKVNSYGDHSIVVWDTEKNAISPPHFSGTPKCVDAVTQFIQIDVRKDNAGVTAKRGYWRKNLEEYKYIDHRTPSNSRYVNRYSCRDHAGVSNQLIEGQVSDPLREDHGILHFDVLKQLSYRGWFIVRLKPPDGSTVEFETTRAAYQFSPPFSSIQQTYIFRGRLYRKGEAPKEEVEKNHRDTVTYSLLSPNPPYEIQVVELPAALRSFAESTSSRKPIYPSFPTFAEGNRILWHYRVTGDSRSGTYLQFGNRVEKILSGHQLGVAVSPNGCKFLYINNSGQYDSLTHNPRESNRLEFIDFCGKTGQ